MKKTLLKVLVGIIILVLVIMAGKTLFSGKNTDQENGSAGSSATSTAPDIRNLSYVIDEETIALKNGAHEERLENSVAIERTEIVKSATGELNDDDITDAGIILVQSGGGTGIFYSLAAAYSVGAETKTTPVVFLGDRIIVKNISLDKQGRIVVSYLDRRETDPMAAEPTVPVVKTFVLKNKQLIEQ